MNPDDPPPARPRPSGRISASARWYCARAAAFGPSPPPPPPSDGGYPGGYQGGGYPGGGYPGGGYEQEPDPWDEDQGRRAAMGGARGDRHDRGALQDADRGAHASGHVCHSEANGGLGGPALGYAVLGGVIMMVLWVHHADGADAPDGQGLRGAAFQGAVRHHSPGAQMQIELMEIAKVMDANLPLVIVGGLVMICTILPLMMCLHLFLSSAVMHVLLMIVGGAAGF